MFNVGSVGGHPDDLHSILSRMGYKPIMKPDDRNWLRKKLFPQRSGEHLDWNHYKKDDVHVTIEDVYQTDMSCVVWNDARTFAKRLHSKIDTKSYLQRVERNKKLESLGIL